MKNLRTICCAALLACALCEIAAAADIQAAAVQPAAKSGAEAVPAVLLSSDGGDVSLRNEGAWCIGSKDTFVLDSDPHLNDIDFSLFSTEWRVDFGITDSVIWNIYHVTSPAAAEYVLYTRLHKIDRINFYIFHQDGTVETDSAGQEVPVTKRSYAYRRPSFNFSLAQNEKAYIMISLRGRSSIYRDFTITGSPHFFNRALRDETLLFFYFGALLIITLYNLAVYAASRDKNYLYYVLYQFFMILYHFTIEGYANLYIWPHWLWFMPRSYNIFIAGAMCMGVIFTMSYLDLKKNSPRLYIMGRILVPLFAAEGLLFFVTTHGALVAAGSLLIIIGLTYFLSAGIYIFKKRYEPASFFLTAWTCLIAGIFITSARRMHLLPDTFFTEYALYIGHLAEVTLLALALGDRVRHQHKRQIEAEEALDEANTRILQNRMKPHFLFNTMNIIFQQLRESPPEAQESLHMLSDNYRYLTDAEDTPLVPLEQEWQFLCNYLGLMEKRWPGRLVQTLTFDDRLRRLPVPPVILQPLAENAFKYGLRRIENKEITAQCSIIEGNVVLSIAHPSPDPLGPVNYTRSLGNIKKRLTRFYTDADLVLFEQNGIITARISFAFPGGPV